ncbi:GumC family protein [Parabacteroides goldsteinii]|uniref:GumC family protein n=1 Tax=Parabacteroides goldsteinii TaxID=328812 RepID=UPI003996B033
MENKAKSSDNEVLELKRIVVNYLFQWKLILGVFIVSLIFAALYIFIVPKTYEIMARIKIKDEKGLSGGSFGLGEAAGLMRSFGLGGGGTGSVSIDDEISILTSNSMVRKVVFDLGLNVNYIKPASFGYNMYKDSPLLLTLDSTTALSLMENITFDLSVSKDGTAKVKVSKKSGKQTFNFSSLPAKVSLPEGDFVIQYRNGAIAPLDMEMMVRPVSWVAEDMVDGLLVEEYSKSSNIIELTCTDYEYKRGVDVLNTLITLYNQESISLKLEEANKSLVFVDGRLSDVMLELTKVERKIEQYKLANRMTDIEFDIQFYIGQMQELQAKIIELETQMHVVEMVDVYVKNPANKYNLIPMLMSQDGNEKSSNSILLYNDKLLERSRLLRSSEEDSPLVLDVNEQVEKMRESVFLTISNSREGIQLALSELKNKEKQLIDKMGVVPTLEREYIDYKRQQEIYQGVYLILLQKKEELALTIGEQKDKVQLVDTAFVKQKTVAPRMLYAAIGVFLFTLFVPVFILLFWTLFKSLKDEFDNQRKNSSINV